MVYGNEIERMIRFPEPVSVNTFIHNLMLKVRDEELQELDHHLDDTCVLPVAGGSENSYGKVNILLQTYVSRGMVDSFSLVSDSAYVAQVGFKTWYYCDEKGHLNSLHY